MLKWNHSCPLLLIRFFSSMNLASFLSQTAENINERMKKKTLMNQSMNEKNTKTNVLSVSSMILFKIKQVESYYSNGNWRFISSQILRKGSILFRSCHVNSARQDPNLSLRHPRIDLRNCFCFPQYDSIACVCTLSFLFTKQIE